MRIYIFLITVLSLVKGNASDDDMIWSRDAILDSSLKLKQCVNASNCKINKICAKCRPGFSPGCTQVECVKGKCKITNPCTISKQSTSTTVKTSTNNVQCKTDSNCVVPEYCALQCPDGFGPQCASAQCVDGKCVIIKPCSKTIQCTLQDMSKCGLTPKMCALCLQGFSPPCSEVTCVDGQCKTISPCSIRSDSTQPITPPTKSICVRNEDCPQADYCASECSTGTGPRCALAKCINGQCVDIKPCSQRSCTTKENCSYDKNNCKICSNDNGPSCEEPSCENDFCSVVSPCSKQ